MQTMVEPPGTAGVGAATRWQASTHFAIGTAVSPEHPAAPPAMRHYTAEDAMLQAKAWQLDADVSPRVSASGLLYAWCRKRQKVTHVLAGVVLTEGLLTMLTERLPADQVLVSVARAFGWQRESPVPGSHLKAHALWLIRRGKVLKVRQEHQHQTAAGRYSCDPRPLLTHYQPPHTELSYEFVMPNEVHALLR